MYNFCCSLKIVDITDEVTQSSDIEMDNVVVDEVNAKKLNKDTRVSRACIAFIRLKFLNILGENRYTFEVNIAIFFLLHYFPFSVYYDLFSKRP